MPDPNEEIEKLKFRFENVNVLPANEDGLHKFEGVAYAGGLVVGNYWWEEGVLFDTQSLEIPTPLASLYKHDDDRIAGVISNVEKNADGSIKVQGHFVDSPDAEKIIKYSKQHFPWQMSLQFDNSARIKRVEDLGGYVNGKKYDGHLPVITGGRVIEISWCSLGADSDTSARAMSRQEKQNQQPVEDTDVTELEQTKVALAKAEQDRDAAQAELKKFKADKRAEDIAALEAELKTQFSADDKTAYTNMDDSIFAFTAKQLRQFSAGSQQPPAGQQQQAPLANPAFAHLFNHQATGGQGGQAPQGSALDQAFAKFAAAQESK